MDKGIEPPEGGGDHQMHMRMMGFALAWGWISDLELRDAAAQDGSEASLAWLRARLSEGQFAELETEARSQTVASVDEASTACIPLPSQGSKPSFRSSLTDVPTIPAPGIARNSDLPPGHMVSDALRASALPHWGPFERLRLIGEGGMARIFKAFDPRLRRQVALKILRKDDPDMLKRFIQEARLQALVEHENVCRIFEAGEISGHPFIAMQLIRGETLKTASKNLSLEEKATLMVQVCEGVHAAHRRDLIHRDIKPANLMVAKDEDGRSRAFVLDFGLARNVLAAEGMTATGCTVGTVMYMPPEQVRGDVTKVDRRADIYALGATLYEMFTGATPFAPAEGLEAMQKIVGEEPPAPRKRNPKLPRDLETIVLKCLEKEPTRRYESARALGWDLQSWLDGEPIVARPISRREKVLRFAKRNKLTVGAATVTLCALLALSGGLVASRITAAARARWAQHFGQESERIEALIRYAHMQPAHDIGPETAAIHQRLERLQKEIQEAGSSARGAGAYSLGRGFLALGELDRARIELEKAWASGFRTPEAAYALGRTWAALFQREAAKAQRIPDLEARQARIKALESSHKGPAQEFLRRGQGAALESAAFQEGLLALMDKDYSGALAKSRAAYGSSPWFYEAKELEAEVHFAEARAAHDLPSIRGQLGAAFRSLEEARAIAPSDPALLDLEDRRWQEEIALRWTTGEDPEPIVRTKVGICESWRGLEPGNAEPLGRKARALAEAGRYASVHGQDPGTWLRGSIRAAEDGIKLDPQNVEALAALASCSRSEGLMELNHGRDPRPQLNKAITYALSGLAVDPDFMVLNNILSACYIYKWGYERQRGIYSEAETQQVLDHFEKAAADNPDLASYHAALGTVLVEAAETKRVMGLDTNAEVRRGLEASNKALTIGPVDPVVHLTIYYLHMIRAQQNLSRHESPEEDLGAAAEALDAIPDYRGAEPLGSLRAEIELSRGRWCLWTGKAPEPSLGRVRAFLRSVGAPSPDSQRRWAELCLLDAEARWTRGGNLEEALAESRKWIERMAASGKDSSMPWLFKAQSKALRFRIYKRDVDRIAARADLERALGLNPRLAEAQALRKSLED